MSRYRDGWMLVTAATTTVGAWLALWTWSVAAVLGVFACAAFAGGFVAALVDRECGQSRTRQVVAGGSIAGGAAVSAAGLVVLCGTPGLLVVGVLVATCPKLWRAIRWWRLSRAPRPGSAPWRRLPEQPAETGPAKVSTIVREGPGFTSDAQSEPWLLDDLALCSAWRRSSLILEHHRPPATHLQMVQQRQLYLDELERRNPTGVAAWLASAHHGASDPTRFIVPRRP